MRLLPVWSLQTTTPESDLNMGREEYGEKPTVKIKYHKTEMAADLLAHITAGLEEQSVPWELVEGSGTIMELGREASIESPLRIGIGMDKDFSIGLFHAKIDEKPLFLIKRATVKQARTLGENAGKLVKRLPLKSLENSG